jgi:hypothetical protein
MRTEFSRNRPMGRSVPNTRTKFSQWNSWGSTVKVLALTVWSLESAIDTTNTSGTDSSADTTVRVA